MDNIPGASKTFCYWSTAGRDHIQMLRTLVKSARRAGVAEDFHVWSYEDIEGAITHPIDDDAETGNVYRYEFKLKYLKKVRELNYDYYIFLDADDYFIRKPRDPLTLLKGDPAHIFFETDLTDRRQLIKSEWWGIPLPVFVRAMRDLGVKSEKIYNIGAAFWIISREHVDRMIELAYVFWKYMDGKRYDITEEPPLSYAMHMLCADTDKHLYADNLDFYGSYIVDEAMDKLPDGTPWMAEECFTGRVVAADPAIAHCLYSKKLLIGDSYSIYEKIFYRTKRTIHRIMERLNR